MKTIKLKLSYNTRQDGKRIVNLSYGLVKIATDVMVLESDWDELNETVLKSDRLARQKNARLMNLLTEVQDELGSKQFTDERFKAACRKVINGVEETPKDLLDYWDAYQSTKTEPGTLRVYSNARKKIVEFDSKVTFATLNKDWLIRFNAWLLSKGYNVNYISIIMRTLRTVCNYCLDCDYTTSYPFRRFQIKQEDTRKRALSRDQLLQLRDYPVEAHQEKYRDAFMLSFYLMGINFADLFELTRENVNDGRIVYRRAKTGTLYNIRIEPEAQAIIDKYPGKHLFGIADEWSCSNFLTRCNRGLKQIGPYDLVGRGPKKVHHPILPELSTYWARHTWATLASKLDVPVDVIAQSLGHKDAGHRITNIYIEHDTTKVDNANRIVLDSLSSNK